jgi:hypothetical protein
MMVLKEMQIRQAKVIFVDDYISKNNVTKEQSVEVLNRVAARMQLQLTMQLNAKRAAGIDTDKPSE